MRRRNFLVLSGSAVLSSSGAVSMQKPVVGFNFELSGVPEVDPSKVTNLSVEVEELTLTPKYIDDNSNLDVTVRLITDNRNSESAFSVSVTNGVTKDVESKVGSLTVKNLSNDDSVLGRVVVNIDHPDISDEYIRRFTISGSEIAQNGEYHYYGNDGGSLRYNNLSTPFEIDSDSFPYSSSNNFSDGHLILNRDGTKGLFKKDNTDDIDEISFSTPFDPSTATTVRSRTHDGDQRGGICAFGSNLDKLLYSSGGKSGSNVYEYSLNDTFDLSELTLDETHTMPQDTSWGNWFSENGDKWYSADLSDNKFYQFNLSTPFDLSSVDSTDSMSDGVSDSSSAIVTGENGDVLYTFHHSPHDILRYDLTDPYDITTATNGQNFGEKFNQDVGQYIHAPPWY